MLDRTIAPGFKPIKKVTIPQVDSSSLSNGRKVFFLNDSAVEVFKIDLVIPCGSWFAENYNLISLAKVSLYSYSVPKEIITSWSSSLNPFGASPKEPNMPAIKDLSLWLPSS